MPEKTHIISDLNLYLYTRMSSALSNSSTPIVPSSKAPAVISRPSKLPQPASRQSIVSVQNAPYFATNNGNAQLKSIYEKNLNRRVPDVSLSVFSFMFAESIQYLQKQSNGIQDLEARYVKN